jgi:hypothetical protein
MSLRPLHVLLPVQEEATKHAVQDLVLQDASLLSRKRATFSSQVDASFPEERFHDLGQHKGIFVICGACKASTYQTGAYKAKRNPRRHEFPAITPERQRRFWRVVGTDMVSEPRPRQEARYDAPITSSESADGLSAICQKERDGQSTGRANNSFLKKRNMFHLVECR